MPKSKIEITPKQASIAAGMIEFCIENHVCMGMGEGIWENGKPSTYRMQCIALKRKLNKFAEENE
jgi:hypothetical protein